MEECFNSLSQRRRQGLHQTLCMGAFIVLSLSILLFGCGGGNYKDAATKDGKQAIIEDVNRALGDGNCDKAIEILKPVYASANVDNDIRMSMASAYACKANLNFFSFMFSVISNVAVLGLDPITNKTGFFALAAKLFPGSGAAPDKTMEAGLLGQDALMAALKPAAVILPTDLFYSNTVNPISTNYVDRIDDANAYLFFITIATMGSIENQFFPINSGAAYILSGPLPWKLATAIDTNACAYAASIMNMADGVTSLQTTITGPLKNVITQLAAVNATLDAACKAGCNSNIISVACNTGCTQCPLNLRNRASCTQVDGDPASCAAAALITSIETSWGPAP